MMDLRNSHTTDVVEVQKSISCETLEGLKLSGIDWYAPTTSEGKLSAIEAFIVNALFNNDVFFRIWPQM